eukprot:CAMPEP_0181458980 /NCGR_PEP_ID=MMETSP1110-20121109/32590_1 /TAXON_ID=174948 /ORGANISM="Symbiodinium sp., Strain CCMP421" /LENGTH=104 /DNA_ID=CAMNT_0023583487 /DNA_START=585 /DNA_END=900 /DNA_ORIENTATION=-
MITSTAFLLSLGDGDQAPSAKDPTSAGRITGGTSVTASPFSGEASELPRKSMESIEIGRVVPALACMDGVAQFWQAWIRTRGRDFGGLRRTSTAALKAVAQSAK